MTRATSRPGYATRLLPVLALLLSLFLPSAAPAFIRQDLPDPVFFPDADAEICRNVPVDTSDPTGMWDYRMAGPSAGELPIQLSDEDALGLMLTQAGGDKVAEINDALAEVENARLTSLGEWILPLLPPEKREAARPWIGKASMFGMQFIGCIVAMKTSLPHDGNRLSQVQVRFQQEGVAKQKAFAKAKTLNTMPTPKPAVAPQKTAAKSPSLNSIMRQVETVDVSTPRNGAVFWTGYERGNQAAAMKWAAANGKSTIEMTPGGQWLNSLDLYGVNSPLTRAQADAAWLRMSERFTEGASGHINAFTRGTSFNPASTFYNTELPGLRLNPNVSPTITYRGY